MADVEEQTGAPESGRPPRVILAEDDAEMAHVLEFLLGREGYRVELVRDGQAAVDRILSGRPVDAAVIDVMMPFVSGLQVVRTLRETADWEDVPVIVVSGKSSETDVVRAFDAGADDYLTKPFRPKEFVARVRALLERRRRAHRVA